jgi:two-component system response regulator HydG
MIPEDGCKPYACKTPAIEARSLDRTRLHGPIRSWTGTDSVWGERSISRQAVGARHNPLWMVDREPPADLETRRERTQTAAASTEFDVLVVQGANEGTSRRVDTAAGKILVGTAQTCELRLSDRTVSRRHVSLELSELGLLVTDLGSTNGTFLNEARVTSGYLGERDRLRLGSTVLQASPRAGEKKTAPGSRALGRMASSSPRMLNVLALCEQLARTDVPIVLEGETGTGKELLAECIHDASPRAQQPFVVLDCRTTPAGLVEAHLFGEVSRADGAVHAGIFELAHGGTLLIDEPGDLSLEVQTKLLRALDKGVIVRVGDTKPTQVDARVIVATASDLDKLVEERKFREDLYYRLAGARIELPPLRKRREDIPLLAGELWTDLGGRGLVPDEFLERFEGYDWPGNVRELAHAVERFLALGEKASLLVARSHRHAGSSGRPDLATENEDVLKRVLAANLGYSEARHRVLEEFERAYLEKALADHRGNVGAAAAASGIARRYFQRLRARQR